MSPNSRARLRLLVLFGGRSSEHGVSCLSARNVVAAADPARYELITVGITTSGRWTLVDGVPQSSGPATMPAVGEEGATVTVVQTHKGPRLLAVGDDGSSEDLGPVDVCFPVLHGSYGEDGTVQGMLASQGVPYVGADVTSSAIAMDKPRLKALLGAAGLPQIAYSAVSWEAWQQQPAATTAALGAELGYPMFTKPARQGSSIGISRCEDGDGLAVGLADAFAYDRVAVVEQALTAPREIECGVLGNSAAEVTRPGETVHRGVFYDFDAKYHEPVELRCPADVPEAVQQRCMDYARRAYATIGARGMARVDFFYLEAEQTLLVNELNTIPGLTASSMFPPLWAAEGMEFPAVVDRLVALALEAAEGPARFPP